MFNVKQWAGDMQSAIDAKDAETLAVLLAENDHNGVYSYDDYCNEFGETTRDEWVEGTIDCAERTLEDLEEHLTPDEWLELIRS